MVGSRRLANFTFIGFSPRLVISAKSNRMTIWERNSDEKIVIETDDPLRVLREILSSNRVSSGYRFIGGAVGFISYDAVRYWEDLPGIANDNLGFPYIHMGIYDDGLIFDRFRNLAIYFYTEKSRLKDLQELSERPLEKSELSYSCLKGNLSQRQFEKRVEKAKEYIYSGDIFQVVLSKRYELKINGSLSDFYFALRRINPSPYMYYLNMGETKIIGASPEMLVRVEEGQVETFPIAGTRPRVRDAFENMRLSRDLLSDPKERAEHLMLVDLARNDVGKVSEPGSVRVTDFMKIQQYSHVQHIVSRVIGELRSDCTSFDAFRAMFPAGTVSGAPKLRAMEIIEELEPTRRGPYAGAVGYFSFNGNADFAITIRTLVARGDRCYIQAGAGIVADSVPEREWLETEQKLRALTKALELSEEAS
jgi:anthranilate synthase component 1